MNAQVQAKETSQEMVSGSNKEKWIQQGIQMLEEEMQKGFNYLQAKQNVMMRLQSNRRQMKY